MYNPSKKQTDVLENLKKIDANIEIKWDEQTGSPLRVKGVLAQAEHLDPGIAAIEFLDQNKGLFLLDSVQKEMLLKRIDTDRLGARHVRMQQVYKELPVFGSEIIVHIDANNKIKGTTGKLTPGIDLPEKPKITDEQALKVALGDDRNNSLGRLHAEPALMILTQFVEQPHLVWHVTVNGMDRDLKGDDTPAKWEYFVDALSGEIVWKYNNEQTHTRTTGSGIGRYSGAVTINTVHDHGSAQYQLDDQWLPSSARVTTHDANGGYPPAPVSEDNNNNWSAASQGPDVDCHLYTRMVYDYFFTVHGRDSYDDAGADMHIYANCGANWNNASWNGSYVKIGNGDGIKYDPLCALDIIAHEWTHAVTEYTANLVYSGESGALNESMSDVFAALIAGNWIFGEDAWLLASAPGSRNMEDPTNGGLYDPANPIDSVLAGHQPDHMTDKYTGAQDYGGVHINSGIMNKAAYLIATGGTHRGIRICEGLGRDVLGIIYYQALTTHLVSSSDFSDMRDAVLDSLDDLYATNPHYSRWRASIINAFAAVGIGTAVTCPMICWIAPFICPPAPHILCPPSPYICPPSPHFACPPSPYICPPAPDIVCPPSPIVVCPPSPHIACPPSPGLSCLPGPDPLPPYIPDIRVRRPEITLKTDIIEIVGIGPETANLFKGRSILTLGDFMKATENEKKITELSKALGISEAKMHDWRKKTLVMLGELK
ncbi:M4 family metallopeptidase [Methanolobus mangrovi]|uniref:M4 family metallopeptidase n=1 Tax=Methanolobus mangrovi TaxID=3072977 RepID=A0AA51YH75_9EURY|nr:M4 family metallopeptidase [Methanolobus mangrovi]WMW22876.1 M4 family metallopeptidase [Methanolobus mangrovi]